MKATMKPQRKTIPYTLAAGFSLAACLSVPATAADFRWTGAADDGVWQAGASQDNWDGGFYNPGSTDINAYRFVDSTTVATEQITLQGGHQPLVDFMHFLNLSASLNVTVDGTDGSKLVWVPNTGDNVGVSDNVRVNGGITASIDAVDGGTIELRDGVTTMLLGGNATLAIDAPIVGTGSGSRIVVTSGAGSGGLSLNNDTSTFEGGIHSQDYINFTSVGDIGEASSLGTGTQGDIQVGNTTSAREMQILYTGPGTQTTNREIVIVPHSTIKGNRRVLSQEGTLILTGGIRLLDDGPLTQLRLGGEGDIEVRGDTGISGNMEMYKIGAGNVTLDTASGYTGETRVLNGTLRLEAEDALPQGSNVVLRGNLEVADVTMDLGTLEVLAPANEGDKSTIVGDVDTPFNLSFADSSTIVWNNQLEIINWTSDSLLRFGTNETGLTSTQLSLISIDGMQASIDSSGYLLQIPEPGTLITVLGLTGTMMLLRRRNMHTA